MKIYLVIVALLIVIIKMDAQQYLIVDNSGELMIINYNTKIKTPYWATYKFGEQTKLEDIYGYDFVGYSWEDDALVVYLEQTGKVSKQSFNKSYYMAVPVDSVKLNSTNLKALYRNTDNLETVYSYENIKIVSSNGLNIKCYNGATLLWEKRHKIAALGMGTTGAGYQSPVLSIDKKNVLFEFKNRIIEVCINTGKETMITSQGSKPSYSPDNNYILFFSGKGYWCIYDKKEKKEDIHTGWLKAFWLYK